jgi:hypothetical protein
MQGPNSTNTKGLNQGIHFKFVSEKAKETMHEKFGINLSGQVCYVFSLLAPLSRPIATNSNEFFIVVLSLLSPHYRR